MPDANGYKNNVNVGQNSRSTSLLLRSVQVIFSLPTDLPEARPTA